MYDLIFVVIMALALFIGYRVGFLKAVVSFVGVIISAIGGYLLYPYITPILMSTPLNGFVNGITVNALSARFANEENLKGIAELFEKYNVTTIEAIVAKMSEGITLIALKVLSVLIVIILIKILMMFLKGFTGAINKIPIIGALNRFLGMVMTGSSALTIIYIIVAVMLMPPSNSTEFAKDMCAKIDKSIVVSRVMEYNFFINYKSLSGADNNME